MTPIGHCGTGMAAAGIISFVLNRLLRLPYRAIIVISFISSLLPDIDGLSLFVSHQAYYGKEWYSHHMFGHSLISAAGSGIIIALIYLTSATAVRGTRNLFRVDKVMLEFRFRRFLGAFLASFTGYSVHLLGDMLTPPGPWGGIALLWPSTVMYGGTGRIFWHNWYIVYMSIAFMGAYTAVQLGGGIFSLVDNRITRRITAAMRAAAVIICIAFLADIGYFISRNDYRTAGSMKWEDMNRQLVPVDFLKTADSYYLKALTYWKKTAITKQDLLSAWNGVLSLLSDIHSRTLSAVNSIIPAFNSSEEDLAAFRYYQGLAPGMEDDKPGKYRMWIVKDMEQNYRFYDRGFVNLYIYRLKKNVLQATNAWMAVFRIDETDESGKATAVTPVYYSSKIYVPDSFDTLLKSDLLKYSSYDMWKHDRKPYNLIPRSAYSRNNNLLEGFYPSMTTVPGYIWPGKRTGIMIHSGVWSEGCIISVYGHLNIGSLVQSPFYRVWNMADTIVDISKLGSAYRGREKVWGKLMMIKNPQKKTGYNKVASGQIKV